MSRKKKILQAHQTRILLEDMSQSWVGMRWEHMGTLWVYRRIASTLWRETGLPLTSCRVLSGEGGYFPGGVGGTSTLLFLSRTYKQMESFRGAREVSGQVQAC